VALLRITLLRGGSGGRSGENGYDEEAEAQAPEHAGCIGLRR
jgi:hypothetical protein